MKDAHQWFNEYGVSHQNHTNKIIHWICVPLIYFSIVGLFSSIPHQGFSQYFPSSISPYFNVATILLLFGSIFYLLMSFAIFIGMLLFSAACIYLNVQLEQADVFPLWILSALIFVFAWIGQFIGHNIEGQKPSFFKDIQFLMIGPAWLLGFIYRKIGIKY